MTTPNESAIRDSLMQRLELIEPGLQLVQREHYLRNEHGASGFLDILARDSKGRLVVIEIKKTDAAAREALQELFKYAALLRSKYLVRELDYRLVILAVEWHELLVPYSEFLQRASYEVSAGKVILDSSGLPERTEAVEPIETSKQRKFSTRHFLWAFQSQSAADLAAENIADHMQASGLRDFVLVRSRPTDARISDKTFLYFAQQELSLNEYQALLRRRLGEEEYQEYVDGISGLVEEEDRISESADQVWLPGYDALYGSLHCTDSEISHPEKAGRWFGEGKQAEVHIFRHGRFVTDFISDEAIVSELIGHQGTSDIHLRMDAKVSSGPQMSALSAAIENVCFYSPTWRGALKDLLMYAQRTGAASVSIAAFCNDDVLRAVAGMAFEYPGFAPTFRLTIQRGENQTEQFIGLLEWDGSSIAFEPIVRNYFDGDPFGYFMAHHFGGHRSFDQDIMRDLGLSQAVFREGPDGPERVRVQGAAVLTAPQEIRGSIPSLIDANAEEVKKIVDVFMNHDEGFRRIITDWVNRAANPE
ncbi:endonuclease NucS domain-containing protein [Comamonas sp.]|uniref:endonuclease NucS domain-containing protein n=1 Tax=Comamonas sp. TaxID=34028 RepID=UPI001AD1F1F8|nr:endonuclease NucS domain-containing protein [Comamonas sp.]MBN9330860.1 DUF91 domain-containing protein [Comamonas sp.]